LRGENIDAYVNSMSPIEEIVSKQFKLDPPESALDASIKSSKKAYREN